MSYSSSLSVHSYGHKQLVSKRRDNYYYYKRKNKYNQLKMTKRDLTESEISFISRYEISCQRRNKMNLCREAKLRNDAKNGNINAKNPTSYAKTVTKGPPERHQRKLQAQHSRCKTTHSHDNNARNKHSQAKVCKMLCKRALSGPDGCRHNQKCGPADLLASSV